MSFQTSGYSVSHLDGPIDLSPDQHSLIGEVLQTCAPELRAAAGSTPAYLLSDAVFGHHFDRYSRVAPGKSSHNGHIDDRRLDTEYMAVFTTDRLEVNQKIVATAGAKIVLCPERIEECSERISDRSNYDAVLLKVILHEWMHASLSVDEDGSGERLTNFPVSDQRKLRKALEESLANFGALQAIASVKRESSNVDRYWTAILEDAIGFVVRQPSDYALGAEMFLDANENYVPEAWRAMKDCGTLAVGLYQCAIKAHSVWKPGEPLSYSALRLMWRDSISRCLRS